MKKFLKIRMLLTALILLGNMAGITAAALEPNTPALTLAVVFDCSMMADTPWAIQKEIVSKCGSAMDAGTSMTLIIARPSKPYIAFSSSGPCNGENLNRILADIHQPFLARADIAAATGMAFDLLSEANTPASACLVISDGKHGDGQVAELRRLATLFKKHNWPLMITADTSANSDIFLAGSQGELSVTLLDKIDVAAWIDSVRPHTKHNEVSASVPPLKELKGAVPVSIPPPPITVPPPDNNTAEHPVHENRSPVNTPSGEPNNRPSSQPAMPPTQKPSTPAVPEVNDVNNGLATMPFDMPGDNSSDANDVNNAGPRGEGHPENLETANTSGWWQAWIRCTLIVMCIIACAAVVSLVVLNIANIKRHEKKINADQNSDELFHLVAVKDDNFYDLGIETSIKRLVFGSSPASAVPITDDGVEAEEFTLCNKGTDFEVKNTSSGMLNVNGVPLKPRKRLHAIFPLSVQSEHGLSIVIIRESITETVLSEGEIKHESSKSN
jgi:hypothetical protein